MGSLLYCEFLKLKRSKIFIISILGGMVAPIMMFVDLIKIKLSSPDKVFTYSGMLDSTNLYTIAIFGIVVYALIASYLFSREYTENTLKSILTIPVSKASFLASKFLMLYIWMMVLTLVSYFTTILVCVIGRVSDPSLYVLIDSLKEFLIGASLLFLVLSPFVFITIWLKSLMPPIIAAATIVMGNVALSNEDLGVLFPWSSPYLIASGKVYEYSYPIEASLFILLLVSVLGVVFSFIYFKKQDIK